MVTAGKVRGFVFVCLLAFQKCGLNFYSLNFMSLCSVQGNFLTGNHKNVLEQVCDVLFEGLGYGLFKL